MQRKWRCIGFLGLALLWSVAACRDARTRGHAGAGPHPLSAQVDDVRASLRSELRAHRQTEIARLHAYAESGEFPHNYDSRGANHIFRDAEGRLCAVANLVHLDGRDDLVDEVVRTKNDLVVADVHDGPLYGWMLSTGLTQEELAHIQVPSPRMWRARSVAKAPPAPPLEVAVKAADTVPAEEQMRAEVRALFGRIGAELVEASDKSLELAVDRLLLDRRVRHA
jgi:hypothetical protein